MWASLISFAIELWRSLRDAGQRKLGREEQQVIDFKDIIRQQDAMDSAAANAPENKQELIDKLRQGKICILCFALFLTSCATSVSNVCPAIRDLTPAQENKIADELLTLPSDSKIIPALVEWSRLRAEAKACKENS